MLILPFSLTVVFIVFKGFFFCLLYTSDAADEEDSVDLGGRRIIKKKNREKAFADVLDKKEAFKDYKNNC